MAEADLREALLALDGRSYGEYRRIGGRAWTVGALALTVEHVQGDPFAAPSRVRVDAPASALSLPRESTGTAVARRATADFLHRALADVLATAGRARDAGAGTSGRIEILRVGQEILERTAVVVTADGGARVRLTAGLPADGRRIRARAAVEMLTERLPRALAEALFRESLDRGALARHVAAVEDQCALRGSLRERKLVAFLAEGAVLPRVSGVDDRPLRGALALCVPEELAVELEAPHAGRIRGLAVREGVTLVVGGGYHGKSTLLEAIARSVYDHVPGDGRERCVTVADAVCIRAEDGRSVRGVDLRPFIGRLPLGRSTEKFDTDDASGSTSQAAAIVEALESGAVALLVDEDTAATNFMLRDARMRRLVSADREPITPFLDRVRQLHEERNVSSVLVVGGAGDYLDVADRVVAMDTYQPHDATASARAIAAALPLPAEAGPRAPDAWPPVAKRVPAAASFDARRGRRGERVRSRSTRSIELGTEEIDVSLLAQLVDPAQCRLIGDALLALHRGLCDGRASLPELLDRLDERLASEGIEALAERGFGDRAQVRRHEIAAAINRLRSLRVG